MTRRSTGHLDDMELALVAAGEPASGSEPHVAGCQRCRDVVESMRQVLGMLREGYQLEEPPWWFRTRALAAMRRRHELGSRWRGFLRCAFDSLLAPAPAAALVRGPAAPGRQLRFESDDVELDLRVLAPSEESAGQVTGQVSRLDAGDESTPADCQIEITGAEGQSTTTRPDRFGIFSVAGHFPYPLIVSITTGDWAVEALVPDDAA